MKNKVLLLLVFISLVLCSGCKAQYNLSYIDNKFSEKVVFTDIGKDDASYFSRIYEKSPDIMFDQKHYYSYKSDNGDISLQYNIGKTLTKTKLLGYCYENIYIIDKDDYISLVADGENYCKNYDIEIRFNTDRIVYKHNANKVENGIYIWNNKNKRIELIVEKGKLKNPNKVGALNPVVKIILFIILIISGLILGLCIYKKSKNGDVEDFSSYNPYDQ